MLSHLRPAIRAMAGYTPGEQPREGHFVKLNTNENPYPPSPRVFDAIRAALTGDRLRKYPDPMGTAFCQAASRALGVDPEGILIGNGSDDILTIVTRAFVPEGGLMVSPTPSYLLYATLAAVQGAQFRTVPYTPDWRLPSPWPLTGANLTFLANPNSPSGTALTVAELSHFAEEVGGPLLLDEAYGDFAEGHGLSLVRPRNVIVSRTLSKSYSLAGIRFGFAVAHPALVRELVKVKDSYNCDALSLAAATAAVEDQDYLRATRARVIATRTRLESGLTALGFEVTPSQANFVWCRHLRHNVKTIYEELKRRQILVRFMSYPAYGDGLRITVGTDPEVDQLFTELRQLV